MESTSAAKRSSQRIVKFAHHVRQCANSIEKPTTEFHEGVIRTRHTTTIVRCGERAVVMLLVQGWAKRGQNGQISERYRGCDRARRVVGRADAWSRSISCAAPGQSQSFFQQTQGSIGGARLYAVSRLNLRSARRYVAGAATVLFKVLLVIFFRLPPDPERFNFRRNGTRMTP